MSPLDLSKLSGPDAVVALRSYPRRFREALAPVPDDPGIDELAHHIGSDGTAAIDHVLAAANTMDLLARALDQVAIHDDPVLHPAVLDATQRAWDTPSDLTVAAALADLDAQVEAVADAAERIHGPDWQRVGHAADGPSIDALGLAREAVRTGADELRAAQTALAQARI